MVWSSIKELKARTISKTACLITKGPHLIMNNLSWLSFLQHGEAGVKEGGERKLCQHLPACFMAN